MCIRDSFPPPRVARLHIPADAPGDEAPKDAKFCAIELQDGAFTFGNEVGEGEFAGRIGRIHGEHAVDDEFLDVTGRCSPQAEGDVESVGVAPGECSQFVHAVILPGILMCVQG